MAMKLFLTVFLMIIPIIIYGLVEINNFKSNIRWHMLFLWVGLLCGFGLYFIWTM